MKTSLKAIIVDDELAGRNTLKIMLEHFCPEVEVLEMCSSVQKAFEATLKHHPDLVFLDVEMPHLNGFDFVEMFSKIDFQLVFVTAHEKYAIQAIKNNAVDYLLKPVRQEDIVETINKVKSRINNVASLVLPASLQAGAIPPKLAIPTRDDYIFVPINEILRIEADGNYSKIHLVNDQHATSKVMVSSKTLKEYANLLADYRFLRVHRAHLINLQFIKRLNKADGGFIIMTDSSSVPISESRREEINTKLNDKQEFLLL